MSVRMSAGVAVLAALGLGVGGPEAEGGARRAPTVRIVSPRQGAVETPEVTVEVEAVDGGDGVKGPSLLHNGTRVLEAGVARKEGKAVRLSFTVSLVPGENRLEARATSGDGSRESEPARLTLRYEKAAKPTLHLLAVGASKYAERRLALKYAAADAEALADLFKRRGKALYGQVRVTSLLDEDATRDNIRKALREMAEKAQPRDTQLVFLTGHGTREGQRFYFIPHEFRLSTGGGARGEDLRQQALPGEELAESLSRSAAGTQVLILDVVHGDVMVDLFKGASRGRNVYALAAEGVAMESSELRHGLVTYTLLAGLQAVDRGPLARKGVQTGDPGPVDVLEWFAFAARQMPPLGKRLFDRQLKVRVFALGTGSPLLPLQEP